MESAKPPSQRSFRWDVAVIVLAFGLLVCGWIVVGLLAPTLILPGGVRPPLREVFDRSPSPVFPLGSSDTPLAGDHADLHVEVVDLDQGKQVLTLRVSGHRACAPTCAAEELVFAALRPDEPTRRGLPALMTVPLPARDDLVQATVQLPVQGRIIQYPFDSFDLLLGLALRQTGPDGVTRALPASQAASHLRLSLQETVGDMELSAPVAADPARFRSPSLPLDYVAVEQVRLGRKDAVKLMTVLLVALIAVTALYTVLLRSFHDLVLGFGGLILGVWSVRAILVPSGLSQRTGVDIALLLVIVFLLIALGVRAAGVLARRRDAPAGLPPDRVDASAGAADASVADRIGERRSRFTARG